MVDVLRVGVDVHLARNLQCFEALHRGGYFHPIVGRVRLGPSEYLLRAVLRRDQECGSAADTRIRRAPAVTLFVLCSSSDPRRPPGPVPRECGPFVTLSAPRI